MPSGNLIGVRYNGENKQVFQPVKYPLINSGYLTGARIKGGLSDIRARLSEINQKHDNCCVSAANPGR